MIGIRDLGHSYGDTVVLHDITTDIDQGELVGIIGPSGAGKTTLLRIILGELTPTFGAIESTSREPLAVGYVPQLDAGERTFPITVEEMVLLGSAAFSRRRPWFDRSEKRTAAAVLERLEITAYRNARLSELSGGQFQRALIGRALMSQPALLLLDEPTSGIDLRTRQQVLNLLEDLRQDGLTVVITTHDLNWVAAHLPRIICLNHTIIADGSPSEVLTGPVVQATYGADMDVIFHNGRPIVIDAVGGTTRP